MIGESPYSSARAFETARRADIADRFHRRTVASFVAEAAVIYGVSRAAILSDNRTAAVARARAWAAYHAMREKRSGAAEIGRRLGGRRRSTIDFLAHTHARRHGLPLASDSAFSRAVEYEGPEPSLATPFDPAAAAAARSKRYWPAWRRKR